MHNSFVVDIENLPPCILEDNPSSNSRISVKLQRNLSSAVTDGSSTATFTIGRCNPNKPVPVAESINTQPQQRIAITEENRYRSRKYFKHRTPIIDPRRVLLFFATLSSMGTMLLIYFTLSIRKLSGDGDMLTRQ